MAGTRTSRPSSRSAAATLCGRPVVEPVVCGCGAAQRQTLPAACSSHQQLNSPLFVRTVLDYRWTLAAAGCIPFSLQSPLQLCQDCTTALRRAATRSARHPLPAGRHKRGRGANHRGVCYRCQPFASRQLEAVAAAQPRCASARRAAVPIADLLAAQRPPDVRPRGQHQAGQAAADTNGLARADRRVRPSRGEQRQARALCRRLHPAGQPCIQLAEAVALPAATVFLALHFTGHADFASPPRLPLTQAHFTSVDP